MGKLGIMDLLSFAKAGYSPKDVKELLEMTEKGQIKSCFTNAVTILSYDPLLRDSVRYNELTQRVDVLKNLGWINLLERLIHYLVLQHSLQ